MATYRISTHSEGEITGLIDGANSTYTLASGYTANTLIVFYNGQLLNRVSQVTESNPATGEFTLTIDGSPPESGSEIQAIDGDTVLTPTGLNSFLIVTRSSVDVSTTGEDIIAIDDTTIPRTVTLTTGGLTQYIERILTIKDESGNAGTNNITIDTQGSELIDGVANLVITVNYGSVTIYSDGINFFTI